MGELQDIGKLGEDIAVSFLEQKGYRVLERNWRAKRGELDIIAAEGETIVAVEVKTRSSNYFGAPLASISKKKIATINSLIFAWAQQRELGFVNIRIDAVGITLNKKSTPLIEHVRAVS